MNLPPGLGGFHDEELEKESIPKPIRKRLKTKDGRRTFEYHEDEEDDFALIHQSDTVSETLIGKKERESLRRALHRYVFLFFFSYQNTKLGRKRTETRDSFSERSRDFMQLVRIPTFGVLRGLWGH